MNVIRFHASARAVLLGTAALVLASVSAIPAKASVDPASYGVAVSDGFGDLAFCSASSSSAGGCVQSGPTSATASVLHLPDGVFSGSGAATVSGSPTPVILVSASISSAQLEEGGGSPVAFSAGGSLDYFFELDATPDTTFGGAVVPVLMNGFSRITLTTGDGSNGTSSSELLRITDPQGNLLFGLPAGNGSRFARTLMLTPGVEYGVAMGVSVTAKVSSNALQDEFESASASIDPMFTIDPACGCAGDFQLAFSPDIGNGPVATAVPETASWALMLVGFLGVGASLRTHRRGRTTNAA